MGYNLYITKKENPYDDTGEEISHDDWFDYVGRHPHLKISESMTPTSSSNYVQWGNTEGWWLSWQDGQIDSKNLGGNEIERMVAIASDLGAKVIGEELEQYIANESGYVVEGEKGRILFDRSKKIETERGYIYYDSVVLDPPAERHRDSVNSMSREEKAADADKRLKDAIALDKLAERPWWKFW